MFWIMPQYFSNSQVIILNLFQGTLSSDKNELLFNDFSLNYNNLPEMYRKGTVIIHQKVDFGSYKNIYCIFYAWLKKYVNDSMLNLNREIWFKLCITCLLYCRKKSWMQIHCHHWKGVHGILSHLVSKVTTSLEHESKSSTVISSAKNSGLNIHKF